MSLSDNDKKFIRRYIEKKDGRYLFSLLLIALTTIYLTAWQLYRGIPLPSEGTIAFKPRLLFYFSLCCSFVAGLALLLTVFRRLTNGKRIRKILKNQLVDHWLDS